MPDSTTGDYSQAVSDVITTTHGLVARNAWTVVGRDLFYVSTKGVTSLTLTQENQVKGVDLPLSTPLAATWERINWRLRENIRLAYWDNKLFVAVPLDDGGQLESANLVPNGTTYDGGGSANVTGLTAGQTYLYTAGVNDTGAATSPAVVTLSCFRTNSTQAIPQEGYSILKGHR